MRSVRKTPNQEGSEDGATILLPYLQQKVIFPVNIAFSYVLLNCLSLLFDDISARSQSFLGFFFPKYYLEPCASTVGGGGVGAGFDTWSEN